MNRPLPYKFEVLEKAKLCPECKDLLVQLWQIAMFEATDTYNYMGCHTKRSLYHTFEAYSLAELLDATDEHYSESSIHFTDLTKNTEAWKHRTDEVYKSKR